MYDELRGDFSDPGLAKIFDKCMVVGGVRTLTSAWWRVHFDKCMVVRAL